MEQKTPLLLFLKYMCKINDIKDMIDEYIKCKNSLIYWCKRYVKMKDKEEHLCKKCDVYEHCKEIK